MHRKCALVGNIIRAPDIRTSSKETSGQAFLLLCLFLGWKWFLVVFYSTSIRRSKSQVRASLCCSVRPFLLPEAIKYKKKKQKWRGRWSLPKDGNCCRVEINFIWFLLAALQFDWGKLFPVKFEYIYCIFADTFNLPLTSKKNAAGSMAARRWRNAFSPHNASAYEAIQKRHH